MRRIAIFDFDGTLTSDDTFLSFARHALPLGRLISGSLRAIPALVAWKTGRIDSSTAKERIYSALYKGLDRALIEKKAATFTPRYRDNVVGMLREEIKSGSEVWIVSASLDLWLENIARRLGVNLLCTATSTAADGTLTGRFATTNCRGREKVNRLREAVPDLDSARITVYVNESQPGGGDEALTAIASRVVDLA